MSESNAPTGAGERIANLDLLRGIAICAILPVNILVMGTVGDREGLTYPSHWDLNRILWCLEQILLEGPSRGLFTLLFGAGMALMLRRTEGDNPQVTPVDVWSRRCLALLALGVVQFAVFMWPGEILWTYGIAGLLLLAFRISRPRTLCIVAALLLLGLCGLRAWSTTNLVETYMGAPPAAAAKAAGHALTPAQQNSLDAVQASHDGLYPSATAVNAEIEQRTHFKSLLKWSTDGWIYRHLSVWSWPGVVECLSFMLIGVALYRLGILTGAASTRTYVLMALIGYGLGLPIRIAALAWLARTGFELDPTRLVLPVSAVRSFLYEPARLGVTLGHVALATLLFRWKVLGGATALRALGRTSLTTYSLQSILTSMLFYGFGWVGALSFTSLMLVSVAIWIVTAIASVLWLRRFSMGPAEWLIRAFAYGRGGLS
ncbi:MAG TPA: DUF418 domain-containing protein [Caulobacteraceae bacterium]|jgi:uncharacterized protein